MLEKLKKCCILSGSTLKIIALVSMFIDHIGAGIIEIRLDDYILAGQKYCPEYMDLLAIDRILRNIGRISFPILVFLLVEGFEKTRNAWKYLSRLLLFAVISEVPFDLCMFRTVWYPRYQNVLFTLSLGVLMLIIFSYTARIGDAVLEFFVDIIIAVGMCFVANYIRCDYRYMGIAAVALLYFCKSKRLYSVLMLGWIGVAVIGTPMSALSAVPVAMYNGKRGLKLKYVFYAFYPCHLLLFWVVRRFIFGIN